jgi:biopolymer transport protein ExbD
MSSKKLRNTQAGEGEELKVDMSPMIDMVFLLLIFFIVNASIVIVKMDKKVKIPIAVNAKKQESKKGRIVINVYGEDEAGDGRFRDASGNVVLDSEDDNVMKEYIKKEKEKIEERGVVPRIHLRGHRDSLFKYSRRVIRVAAAAGVNEVIFVSYQTDKGS